ncbi:hypothetical protein AM588_10001648 [Phytophthora nicotianae]|uniref:Cyclic nucleotide-binding domain-containing protein n=1 Tax=Phytophthora nicotianae TaxID=4792 RepID=A0A0W8CV29_PHYNI|nr:hypothetical protein AM588_10001648 [Phytophthora nicotianae]
MTSLWSSHAGVSYDELLEEIPRPIRAACVLHASKEPLDWFVMKVFTPICWNGKSAIEAFTLSLAEQLRFEGYPRDENVVAEGSIVRAMYFVTKGHLNMQSNSLLDRPVGLGAGSYFGERGLLGFSISAYTVRTVRACDLFSLSSEAFIKVLKQHEFSRFALDICSRSYKQIKEKHVVNKTSIKISSRPRRSPQHMEKLYVKTEIAGGLGTSGGRISLECKPSKLVSAEILSYHNHIFLVIVTGVEGRERFPAWYLGLARH